MTIKNDSVKKVNYIDYFNIDVMEEDREYRYLKEIRETNMKMVEEKIEKDINEVLKIYRNIYELFLKYSNKFHMLYDFVNQPIFDEFFVNPCTSTYYLSMIHFEKLIKNKDEVKLMLSLIDNRYNNIPILKSINVYQMFQELCDDTDDIYILYNEILKTIADEWGYVLSKMFK